MNSTRILGIALVGCLLLAVGPSAIASRSKVTLHPEGDDASFEERWSWANTTASGNKDGAWVGWSIDLWLHPKRRIISGDVSIKNGRIVVHGGTTLGNFLDEATPRWSDAAGQPPRPGLVRRPVAVVVEIADGRALDATVLDFEFSVDMQGRSLLWIGSADGDESLGVLGRLFGRSQSSNAREELIEAIGLHEGDSARDFVIDVLESDDTTSVREEAAESLASHHDATTLATLVQTAKHDWSRSVSEEAVEALAYLQVAGTDEALIELARLAEAEDVREEAIEALAQRDPESVIEVLEEIVERDRSMEVRAEAIDALGELDDGAGVATLIEIARTHPSRLTREEALDVLEDLGEDDVRIRQAVHGKALD
jgi:hypothetical protein